MIEFELGNEATDSEWLSMDLFENCLTLGPEELYPFLLEFGAMKRLKTIKPPLKQI